MSWWLSSVCLSVPCLSRERKGVASWKLTEAHDTGDPWPHVDVERSKVKVTRQINAVTQKSAISWEQEGLWTVKLVYGWSLVSCISHVRDDFQADSSVWLSKSLLVGVGALWRPHCSRHNLFRTDRYDTTPLTPACPKLSELATVMRLFVHQRLPLTMCCH